jgi:hypothetical protein
MKRLCLALILLTLPAKAEESIFTLYDHYTVAQVVGELCARPTPEEAEAFVRQFEALGALTEAQASADNPSLTSADFAAFSAKHRHQLQSAAKRFLDDHGCEHTDAVALAAKYREFQTAPLPQ